MKKTFRSIVKDQRSPVPPVQNADLAGKTIVVIGASTGIGFETAKHFARMNPARLILGFRSESRGESAISKIGSATGFKSCELWRVDLADFSSVISFADKFHRESDRLDILVMNAAIVAMAYKETVDGWESTLQVNYLGTVLLSLLLLPCLANTGKKFGSTPRLVIVSSDVYHWPAIPKAVKESSSPAAMLSSPRYRKKSAVGYRYNQTKLLNVLFVRALHDRLLPITPLTVNAVNPGLCRSELRRDVRNVLVKVVMGAAEKLMAWTPEQGSRQLVYAAIGGQDNENRMKGAFVSRATVVEHSDFVISEAGKKLQDNLWRETIAILTKVAPRLGDIVQKYLV